MVGTACAMLAHAANNMSKEDTAATPAHNYKKRNLKSTTSCIQQIKAKSQQ